jgi:hypothetical protein
MMIVPRITHKVLMEKHISSGVLYMTQGGEAVMIMKDGK